MPRTVAEAFRDFHKKLTPSSYESNASKRHRRSIKKRLKKDLDILRFFRTGSFGNGTSISGYSDVDYFSSIPRKHVTSNSYTMLRKVRKSMNNRFPNTGVSIDCPAIIVPFGQRKSEDTEITPARYIKKTSAGHKIYRIPDCNGGWMKSSPDKHNSYVRRVDRKHNRKTKKLIRFVKAWKYLRNVPISSFYLELRTTKYADNERAIIYSLDMHEMLRHLSRKKLANMRDPMGISGYVTACTSSSKLRKAKSRLSTALKRAKKARKAEVNDKPKKAIGWWRKLFGSKFPRYYY